MLTFTIVYETLNRSMDYDLCIIVCEDIELVVYFVGLGSHENIFLLKWWKIRKNVHIILRMVLC